MAKMRPIKKNPKIHTKICIHACMRALPIETLDFINAMAFFSTEHVGWDRHFWLDQGFELKEIRMSHPSLPLYYSHITKFHQSLEGTLYYGLSNYQEVKFQLFRLPSLCFASDRSLLLKAFSFSLASSPFSDLTIMADLSPFPLAKRFTLVPAF